jgi:hypothetical protein
LLIVVTSIKIKGLNMALLITALAFLTLLFIHSGLVGTFAGFKMPEIQMLNRDQT